MLDKTKSESLDPRAPQQHDLDSLAALDSAALHALYARAPEPTSVGPLVGAPRGRMLAVHALDRGLPARWLRRLSGAGFFPWGGKSFAGAGDQGTGINRVRLGGAGNHELFPFQTAIGPSAIDGKNAIILDYDLADNPGLIRAIHDEVRAIEPGLYLGPAMWKGEGGSKTLVLWFALDTRDAGRDLRS